MKISKIVSEHMRKLGRKGGAVQSERKTEACRENAAKPRPNARRKRSPRNNNANK